MIQRSIQILAAVLALTLAGIALLTASAPGDRAGAGAGDQSGILPTYAIWHVATDGDDGTGDGSFAQPFATIQHAVDVASAGDVIEIHPGTYTGDGNRDIDPAGKSLNIRSPTSDPTTCVIDCEGSAAEPHRAFWFHSEEDSTCVVQGLTITGGGGVEYGGGILIGDPDDVSDESAAYTRIRDCIIRENSANNGAGVYVSGYFNSSTALYDTWILDNDGSGFDSSEILTFWFEDCLVEGNTGAGIANYGVYSGAEPGPIRIVRTVVNDNLGMGVFRQMWGDGAGSLVLRECEITNNGGWGAYCEGWAGLDVVMRDCRVMNNGAGVYLEAYGGDFQRIEVAHNGGRGIYFETGSVPNVIREATVYANAGDGLEINTAEGAQLSSITSVFNQGAGLEITYLYTFGWAIENCLLAFNQGVGLTFVGTPPFTVACNDVYGNAGGDWEALPGYLGDDGNISADPLFCDAAADDYGLEDTSPCAPGQHPDGVDCGLIGALGTGCDLAPTITAIDDVPADQGLEVRLTWAASSVDDAGAEPPVTSYALYRRIEDGEGRASAKGGPGSRRLEGWDFVASVPARGDDVYHHVAPTLCDSTAAGICWSTFFVSAATSDPFVYHDSLPDSGYSVDNLVPPPPGAFVVAYGVQNELSWNACEAPDLAWYDIHRGDHPDFEPAPENLVQRTAATAWTDATGTWGAYYQLVAVDDAGNTSDPKQPDLVTPVEDTPPVRTALLGNHPNPFNPSTTIAYDLARSTKVSLSIYDLAGRLVVDLVEHEAQNAGRYRIVWSGKDCTGRSVASGTYISRLVTATRVESRRMTLVK